MKTLSYTLLNTMTVCLLLACDKPTSGQNTHEYRDGNSGASPATVEKDTKLDSAEGRREKSE